MISSDNQANPFMQPNNNLNQNASRSPNNIPTSQNINEQKQEQLIHQNQHRHKDLMKKSFLNPSFISASIIILLFSFAFIYLFVFHTRPSFWLPVLILYLVLFVLTQWSYWMTVFTNPGVVPFYYGMSDQINDKFIRKYCIICHNFKPERSHHCSACGKCILNMDHHCPWVNNCIGFRNRKYFMLFLIYISLGLIFAAIIQIILIIPTIQTAIETKTTDITFALKILMTLVTIALAFTLTAFTLYHIKMILNNTSTLESLIKSKNLPQKQAVDDYDVGPSQNCMQVFGQDCIYWLFPIKGNGPKGNGTSWPKPGDQFVNRNHLPTQYEAVPINNRQQYEVWNPKNTRM